MKLPAILLLVLTLGVGIAVGAYIAPHVEHLGAVFESAPDKSIGLLPGNGDASSPVTTSPSTTETLPPPGSAKSDLSSLLNETNYYRQTEGLLAYAESIPPEKIPNAIEVIEKSPSGDGKDMALSLVIGRWVEIDPKGAQDAIATIQDEGARHFLISGVYNILAAKDPTGTLDLARQLPSKQDRDDAMLAVVEQVARQDPAQALAVYQGLTPLPGRPYEFIFTHWMDKDLDQATQAVLQLPHADNRYYAIRDMAIHLVGKDPSLALQWVEQLPPGDAQNNARKYLVSYVTGRDPQRAANYIDSLQQIPPDIEMSLVQSVMGSWSQSDPKSATLWAESLPSSQSRLNALNIGLCTWARSDPRAALAFLNTLPPDVRAQNSICQGIASVWAQSDPQAALAWVNQLPDGTTKENSLRSVIYQWAVNDPAKAAVYTQSLPDGPMRNDAIHVIAGDWAQKDAAGASAWLTQLPSGSTRDAAIICFCDQDVTNDPNGAYQWAESISNVDDRQRKVANILQRWMQKDPANASIAVRKSSLPPEQQNALLQANH
jgi:hypothetical protein